MTNERMMTHYVGDTCDGGHRDEPEWAREAARQDKAIAADAILRKGLLDWRLLVANEYVAADRKIDLLTSIMEDATELYG